MHKISIALHIAMALMLVLLGARVFLLFLHVGIVLKEQALRSVFHSYRNGFIP